MARTPIASRSMKLASCHPCEGSEYGPWCRREPWTLPGFQRRNSSPRTGQIRGTKLSGSANRGDSRWSKGRPAKSAQREGTVH